MATYAPTIDTYNSAITLAQALQDVLKNPQALKDAAAVVAQATKVSAEQVAQHKEIQTSIVEHNNLLAELAKQKAEHANNVAAKLAEVEAKQKLSEDNLTNVGNQRASLKVEKDNALKEISSAQVELDKRKADLESRHQDIVTREQTCRDIVDAVTKRENICASREKALALEQTKLEARKKKLAEAAKDE